MKYPRLVIHSALICLPTVAVSVAIGCLVIREVPRAVRYEPIRIGREYREAAEALFDHPDRATYRGERRKGWRQTGRINGVPWGYVVDGDRTLVWHQVGNRQCQAIEVATISPFPYELVGYVGGTLVILTLLGLAAFSLFNIFRTVRERDDFIAATIHDLKTPLVGMRMAIGRDPESARQTNDQLLYIVNNLRDFLLLGGRRKPPKLVPVDVAESCRGAYALFREDYRELLGGDVPIDVRSPAVAQADPTLLTQVFWNLFGNDLKYAAPYGLVRVSIAAADGYVTVEFIDEGLGMTPWQRRHAFDRYYRARTALESGKGGFGIGLCTSREFARLMGGELSVSANDPRGCVFELKLRG